MARKIVINPGVCFGKPIYEGTRIPIDRVLDLLTQGVGEDEIVKEYYPRLDVEDVRAAMGYAANLIKNEEVVLYKSKGKGKIRI